MYLNFMCPSCGSEIQAEYIHIGEWVSCPVCNFAQVVPDPQLPAGASYGGYCIDRLFDSCLLWYGYLAKDDKIGASQGLSLLRVPTSFFLRNVSNLNVFASEMLAAGGSGIPGLAAIVDKSLVMGKIFFVYEAPPDLRTAHAFINVFGPLRSGEALDLLARISATMAETMRRFKKPHLGLSPDNLMLTPSLEFRIFDYGVSSRLLLDDRLRAAGFNIWNPRYMSPESRAGRPGFSTPASDIYALGAVFHFLLTGKEPFEEAEFDIDTPFPEIPGSVLLPRQFRHILARMTSTSLSERYSSWDELSDAIKSGVEQMVMEGLKRSTTSSMKKRIEQSQSPKEQLVNDPVGLTHSSLIKIDKSVRKRPLAQKPKKGETIAKLSAPLKAPKPGQIHIPDDKKSGKKSQDKLVIGLAIAVVASLAILAGAVVWFVNKPEQKHKVSKAETQLEQAIQRPQKTQPSHQQAAAAASKTPASASVADAPDSSAKQGGPSKKALALLKEANRFADENPEEFEAALKLYDDATNCALDAKDMETLDKIKSKAGAVRDRKSAVVDALMRKLDAQAQPLTSLGDYAGASRIYTDYAGPFKAESLQARSEAARRLSGDGDSGADGQYAEIEAKAKKLASDGRFHEAVSYLESYNGPMRAETSAFRKNLAAAVKKNARQTMETLAPLLKKTTPLLLSLNTNAAQSEVQAAASNPAFSSAKAQLESLNANLDVYNALEKRFIEYMNNHVGKTVRLPLKGSERGSLTVISASDSGALVQSGGKAQDITFKDLSAKAILAFLDGKVKLDDMPLVSALAALQAGDQDALKAIAPSLPLDLENAFSAEAGSADAKKEIEDILDATGLPYDKSDYSSILKNVAKKALSQQIATKLHADITAFMAKRDGSSFLEKRRRQLEDIDGVCLRSGALTDEKIEASPESLKSRKMTLAELVEKAPAGATISLGSGLYAGSVNITKDSIAIAGDVETVVEGGLKISGAKANVSKIVFRKGRLEIANAEEVKLDSCAFLGGPSAIKGGKGLSFNNCLFRGLYATAAKDFDVKHCSFIGYGPLEGKATAGLLLTGEEINAEDCLFFSDNGYGAIFGAKLDSKKALMNNCLFGGASGACTEITEGGSVSKGAAKNEAGVHRYVKASKCIVGEPKFLNAAGGDFALQAGSPGSGAASDGKDCGTLDSFRP